ncbi:MAG: class I SAM-dependent methyltransferase [Acidobacteria bacterium]|nr:class I SAM-dependent methyltransferase [Acidobacteriota bacterium]MBV9474766.1 class I SAM-dependent methyltransferase [Acidobacteriota bacterium]
MPTAVLYPRFEHPAIEERYASWQTQMLLRQGVARPKLVYYESDERASDVVADVDDEIVLVVTDPLLLPPAGLIPRLRDVLASSGAAAVVPVANEAQHPAQRRSASAPYLTLRELQQTMETMAAQPSAVERVTWDRSDPGIYLCRAELLDSIDAPLALALQGRDVAISTNDYVHRWSSLRGQTRYDLLAIISPEAKSILEFGCGEAPLGEALKRRQRCRVVGIELDAAAAAVAKKRIDAVYRGDVRDIVAILDEQFEWIIGGDIVEHLDEPWSFLGELRRVSAPGGHLLLSIPNLANASVVSDLLRGRFDYVYMGLTCVGHVRFFTKQSIADMLTIAGWTVVEITPQELGAAPARDELIAALDRAGFAYSKEDLVPTGYYVVARNG